MLLLGINKTFCWENALLCEKKKSVMFFINMKCVLLSKFVHLIKDLDQLLPATIYYKVND